MNAEAMAETERLHTRARLGMYSTLMEERPLVCVWEPLTNAVLLMLTSANSTQNTMVSHRNIHGTFEICLFVPFKCTGHLKSVKSDRTVLNKIMREVYSWSKCS